MNPTVFLALIFAPLVFAPMIYYLLTNKKRQEKRGKIMTQLEEQKKQIDRERDAVAIKICPFCKSQNTGEVKFCGNCGAGL